MLCRAVPLLALILLLLPFAATAQTLSGQAVPDEAGAEREMPVALIADEVTYDAETGRVTASGNVEVYYGERTLTARRITYDERTDRISAEGDIVLRDKSGATVFANIADLDAELQDGLVRGAQSVITGDVKLAAVAARRVGDRYNALSKAVYSPCRVCASDPTPLWSIRARRVIHDEAERVIHYENATFLIFGVPVAYLPYFRHPDPTVDRASGFLVPSFLSSSIYGRAVKIPYYWVIDPHSDLTVTPFITTGDGALLELDYRRLFRKGDLSLGGSITWNDYSDGDWQPHGFITSKGLFEIGAGVETGWDFTTATDKAFMRRYDYDYGDRLDSELFVRRYRADDYFEVSALGFQSLRENEAAGNLPFALPYMEARWEVPPMLFGGDVGLFTSSYVLERRNGRDSTRFTLGADWEREEILPIGLAITGFAELRGDFYSARNDPLIDSSPTSRLTGHAGVELRYPLIWERPGGASHIVEPIVQGIVAPSGHNDPDIPIEDSLVTEFDALNVISRNHFSGLDSFEDGSRLNMLLRYDRVVDEGMQFDAAVGRVFRFSDKETFSPGSGLRPAASDWVASWQARWDPHVAIRHRIRMDDDFTLAQNEFFGKVDIDPVELTASYAFIESDPFIGAPNDREEISTTAALQLNRNWSIGGVLRRDLERDEFVLLGGSLTWQNECAAIDLFLRRRFTDIENAPASTSFGVNVRLLSLGASNFGSFDSSGAGLFGGGSSCG